MSCLNSTGIDKTTVDSFTDSIYIMFANGGKEIFKDFLSARDFDDAVIKITFWEKCEALLNEISTFSDGNSHKTNILNSLKELYNFADKNMFFYENQLMVLKAMLEENDVTKIAATLESAKKWTLNLLETEHRIFSEYLIKEYKRRICK